MSVAYREGVRDAESSLSRGRLAGLAPIVALGRLQNGIDYLCQALPLSNGAVQRRRVLASLCEAHCDIVAVHASSASTTNDAVVLEALGHALDEALAHATLANPRTTLLSGPVADPLLSSLRFLLEAGTQSLEPMKRRIDYWSSLNKLLLVLRRTNASTRLLHHRFVASAMLYELLVRECAALYEAEEFGSASNILQEHEAALRSLVDVAESVCDDFKTKKSSVKKEKESRAAVVDTYERLETTRDEFDLYLGMCEGQRLMAKGDAHYRATLEADADQVVKVALLAQDDYQCALHTVTGSDLALEGTLLCRLARFYVEVTKMPFKAQTYFRKAVELATSFSPALPTGAWYREAVAAVKEHQARAEAAEAQKWHNRRKPIVERLTEPLERLNSTASMCDRDFCKFVLQNWPPKSNQTEALSLEDDASEAVSGKFFLKMSVQYHPDRTYNQSDLSEQGDEWLVMAEEICKLINGRYSQQKGVE